MVHIHSTMLKKTLPYQCTFWYFCAWVRTNVTLLFTLLICFCSVIQFRDHRRCFKSSQRSRKTLGHWSEEMAGDKTTSEDVRSSRVIRVVFLALLLDLLGFTLILPLLPSILDHYSQTGVRSFFLRLGL